MLVCGSAGYLSSTQSIPSRTVNDRVMRFSRATIEEFPPRTAQEWRDTEQLLEIGQGGSRHTLFIGDSNVFQYYSRIDQLVSNRSSGSRDAVLAVRPSCAPGSIDIETSTDLMQMKCRTIIRKALEFAHRPDVDTVVIGAVWYAYFSSVDDWKHYGERAPLRPQTDRALDFLRKTATALVSAGKRVYIILQMPVGIKLDPRDMIRRTLLPPGFTVEVRPLTKAEVLQAVTPINTKLRVVAKQAGASVIDPVEWLCEATLCPVVSADGEPIYRDSNHLRPSYVRDHVKYLDQTMDDTGGPGVAPARSAAADWNGAH